MSRPARRLPYGTPIASTRPHEQGHTSIGCRLQLAWSADARADSQCSSLRHRIIKMLKKRVWVFACAVPAYFWRL